MIVNARLDGRRIFPIAAVSRRVSTVSTPVDLRYRHSRILIRRVAGVADLTRRRAMPIGAPADTHGLPQVDTEVDSVTIMKARPREWPVARARAAARRRASTSCSTRTPTSSSWTSTATGSRTCQSARIPGLPDRIARRLRRFAWDAPHSCRPSLCYETPEHPDRVQIEVTTHCNLRCGYCTNRLLTDRRTRRSCESNRC